MKLDAYFIEETVDQWCPICRERKFDKMRKEMECRDAINCQG